jgi:hypothetical protein
MLAVLFVCNSGTVTGNWNGADTEEGSRLSINLKAKAVVLGPEVTLGDIVFIQVEDLKLRNRLMSIKVGEAPPPGESFEITLHYIKRLLETTGFAQVANHLNGPRSVRVITAQKEIDKAFVREEFALNSWEPLNLINIQA